MSGEGDHDGLVECVKLLTPFAKRRTTKPPCSLSPLTLSRIFLRDKDRGIFFGTV